MKKCSMGLYAFVVATILCSFIGTAFAQAAAAAAAAPKPQAQSAAQNASPKKTNIAVINLKSSSGVTAGEAELISDRLRGELFNTGKINVMERDQMQEILKEQGFQQSGACSNEACMVEIGQLLGVEQLVSGSLGKVGSMFLVNLRIIDVKTAKIIKVVSEDIKGDIEDVVSNLPGIAVKLVSEATTAPIPIAVEDKKKEEKKPEVKKVEEPKKEEPKEETKVEKPKEEEKKVEVEPSDEKFEKNKNRAGVRLAFNFFGNRINVVESKTYRNSYDLITSSGSYPVKDSDFDKVTYSAFFNPQIKFIIKAGPFMCIDIGPSWTHGAVEYQRTVSTYSGTFLLDTSRIWNDNYNVFGLGLGVNFVKRWYPFKLNVGLLIDFNYMNLIETFTRTVAYDNVSSFTLRDTVYFYNSVNIAPGVRIGAEVMAGKHVGFSFDFIYRYSYFETFSDKADTYDSNGYTNGSVETVYKIDMPSVAFGLGVNFYY